MLYEVVVPVPIDKKYTYKSSKNLNIQRGDVVIVPFGKRNSEIGVVIGILKKSELNYPLENIKEIIKKVKNIKLQLNMIKFVEWVSNYNLYPFGIIMKMVLPNIDIINYDLENKKIEKNIIKIKKINLNRDQKKAFLIIKKNLNFKYKTIVLEGVTGSGKTEVYFEIIDEILKKNKQVLILLPEISLTPSIKKRFVEKFGFEPEIWHSKISVSRKRNIWHNCYIGNSKIIIGARSSLFLPFKNLGLIIVDEEHDISYKQEEGVRYHARDMAIVRSKIDQIPIILSTATPSVETYFNIINKRYVRVFLSKQYSGFDLSRVHLINLQEEKLDKNNWISKKITSAIENCLHKNKQSLVFLNRRGYAPLTICSVCNYRMICDYCSSWLVMHHKKNILSCHHCGFSSIFVDRCLKCKSEKSLRFIGPGIERVAKELEKKFPQAKIEILSSENMNTNKKIEEIIKRIEFGKIDIMVGTQILAKGHNFPSLSLVAVLDSDAGMKGGDLRASEHTYNLLQQVGGRAGRSLETGDVYIQTYFNKNPLIESLKNRDRETFLNNLLIDRKKFNLPPFFYLIAIIISGPSKLELFNFVKKISNDFPQNDDIKFLGPVEAQIFLLRGKYRYRVLLSSSNRKDLNFYTKKWLKKIKPLKGIRITPDVDPYSFM